MEHMATEEQSLEALVTSFLADLARANHSPQTRRAYATDLAQLCAFHQGPIQTITAEVLRTFFGRHTHLRPATRARKQAAVARFLIWAEQQDLLDNNPMRKIDRIKLDSPQPRGMERGKIERILEAIPARCQRDRLFFRLLLETGLRVSEGLSLYQLRHTHATELINDGVSLPTIRKRLGHTNLQTTLRHAEQSDETADAEVRTW
jgi:site-specific recombinase XerD